MTCRLLLSTLTALVVVKAHGSIALIVFGRYAVWAVDWQLQVIWSQTMTMGVGVREQTTYWDIEK